MKILLIYLLICYIIGIFRARYLYNECIRRLQDVEWKDDRTQDPFYGGGISTYGDIFKKNAEGSILSDAKISLIFFPLTWWTIIIFYICKSSFIIDVIIKYGSKDNNNFEQALKKSDPELYEKIKEAL